MTKFRNLFLFIFLNIFFSCYNFYSATVTGEIHDKKLFDEKKTSAIENVIVYLYEKEKFLEEDYKNFWEKNIFPEKRVDKAGKEDIKYIMMTKSRDNGAFSLSNFAWKNSFPEYGRTGDRKQFYLLFYHQNYSLIKYDIPLYIVSGGTTEIPTVKISSAINVATVSGRVVDVATGAGITGYDVSIYVPTGWAYDSNDKVINPVWGESPHTTAESRNGDYSFKINFAKLPTFENNKGTTIIRLVFKHSSYIINNGVDNKIIDAGWILPYYESETIFKDKNNIIPNIKAKKTQFESNVDGYIFKTTKYTDESMNGKRVGIFIGATTQPANGASANLIQNTHFRAVGVDSPKIYNGYFNFPVIQWSDTDYQGFQSTLKCYIGVDSDLDKIWDKFFPVDVVSDSTNTFELQL